MVPTSAGTSEGLWQTASRWWEDMWVVRGERDLEEVPGSLTTLENYTDPC